ncbi:MAG TPA: outer membrane protein assembly factor BamA [Treponemataceae bacterium]|nr:outer membrane protein assembly factor BamA [Treponemataceae bacterium]HQL04201.1 outer membrane protein assembly factor BamA [Treponemataceae bacterium]
MRCARVIVFICLLVSLSAASFSQESEWYYGKPIKNIVFDGLVTIKNSDVTSVTNQYLGYPFSDETYTELLSKVYALEFFNDDITTEALPADEQKSAVIIRFKVTENPVLSKISFSGNSQIRSTEIKDAVSLKEKSILIQSKIPVDERAVRDLYLKKGFTNVRISSSVEAKEDGSVELLFIINEGKSTIVKTILFEGNQSFAQRTLKNGLTQKEKSLFDKGSFQESYIELDKQALLKYYRDRGYIDAVILDVKRDVFFNEEDKRDELTLTYIIREGSQYIYKGTVITGNTLFTTEHLVSKIPMIDGEIFNSTKYSEGIRSVYDVYVETGYTSNLFMPQELKDTDNKTISYTIEIVERPRSYIERIVIRGNDKTKEDVILREIPIETGDVYSQTKIQNGIRNLYNLQFFKNIYPDVQQGTEENLIDLVVEVEEQSTTGVEFGFSFSGITDANSSPVSFFAKLSDSNFLGTGRTLGGDVSLSVDQWSVGGKFFENWLFGEPISLGLSANVGMKSLTTEQTVFYPGNNDSANYKMDYNSFSTAFDVSLGRRWQPNFAIISLTGGVGTVLNKSFYDSGIFFPADITVRTANEKWGLTNTVHSAVSFDDRDLYYDASKGWFASQKLSWTGFIPTVENQFFFRSDTKAEGYVTLLEKKVTDIWSLKFVLFGYSGFSFLIPGGQNEIAPSNKLYIDGMFVGRGWGNLMTDKGQALWSNNFEFRFPVVTGFLALDAFYDVAILKKSIQDMSTISLNDAYMSWGFGMRLTVPQFPLKFLLAAPHTIRDGQFAYKNNTNKWWPFEFVLSFNLVNR